MATLTLSNGTARLRVEAVHAKLGLPPPRQVREPCPAWRRELYARADAVALECLKRWPRVFGELHPLAIGIHRQLEAALPEFTAGEISAFLRRHCGDWRYRDVCRLGEPRIGLDGLPAGTVSAGHAQQPVAAVLARRARRRAKHAEYKNAAASSATARLS